ncbi:MAG: hypothetical protein ACT4QE_05000 [Anaerolineales bacterium]
MFTRVVAGVCVVMIALLWLRGDGFLAFVFFLAACMLIVRNSNVRRA